MNPKQAWGILTVIAILIVAVAMAVLVQMAISAYVVLTFGGIALLLYFYVVYKRYHVEVVPERDIMLFEDKEDLRILSEIYGLETEGSHRELRARLIDFAKGHEHEAFTWVAPRSVISIGAKSTAPEPEAVPRASVLDQILKETDEEKVRARGLVFGAPRNGRSVKALKACPICEAKPQRGRTICPECGADLEFYTSLTESRVGRRIVTQKALVKRRLRQAIVPPTR